MVELVECDSKGKPVGLYADEELVRTRTLYGYSSRYEGRAVQEQVSLLCKVFPSLKASFTYPDFQIDAARAPRDGEHAPTWFAVPRWECLADTYNGAVEVVLAKLAERVSVDYRDCEGELGPSYLRQHAGSMELRKRLGARQGNDDFLVFLAQFGFRHRWRSVRRARAMFRPHEVGLGLYEVATMLLTHPARLAGRYNLCIDCPGDERALQAGGPFLDVPCWYWSMDRLCLGSCPIDLPREEYGSATAVAVS